VPTEAQASPDPPLRDYLRTIWHWRKIVLALTIGIPIVAYVVASQQPARYASAADVLISQQSTAPSLTGAAVALPQEDADRFAVTQARLARTLPVVQATLQSAHARESAADFLDSSSVSASPDSDFLHFEVESSRAADATVLATAYAKQFAAYRQQLDTASISRARTDVAAKLAQLAKSGNQKSPLYTNLLQQQQALTTLEVVQTPRAVVAGAPTSATQVAPRPKKVTAIAAALGLLIGLMAAFLVEALDTRVRSAEALVEHLGLPVVGRIGAPPRRLREGPVGEYDPTGVNTEAFRMVRLNLELSLIGESRPIVMVTSALPREGKTTTAARLALAYAHVGKKVLLVDLDLRRPGLQALFRQPATRGLTHVALGRTSLDRAAVAIDVDQTPPNGQGTAGSLHLLTSGPLPPDPGAFVESQAVASLLAEAKQTYDIVIVDTPPLLDIADGIALSPHVDGVLVVARVNEASVDQVRRMHRMLSTLSAPILGVVVTGVPASTSYRYYGGPVDRTGTLLEAPAAVESTSTSTGRSRRR
jgi:capsular exopolysaccharide synthesis family protein